MKPAFSETSLEGQLLARGWRWNGAKWVAPNKKQYTREEARVFLSEEKREK